MTVAAAPVVFIVEDDASVRRSLERLTRAAGYHALSFATATAFLGAEHARRPACLVLDLRLPDRHGLDVQRELAATDPDMRVVILTSHGDEAARRSALTMGAVAFLSKPCDDRALLGAIARALGEQERTNKP